jgi:clan AA aspartic protease (TIGR02281 family)
MILSVCPLLADTLVFRNGNRMEVEGLKIDETSVVYTIRGMTVKIPIRYIDLEETLKIRAEAEARRRAAEEAQRSREESRQATANVPVISMDQLATRSLHDEAVRDIIENWKKRRESADFPGNGNTSVQMPRQEERYRLSFTQQQGVIMLTTRVNDRVNTPFIFDTGASYTTISARLAQSAGILVDARLQVPIQTANGVSHAYYGVIERLQLGELLIRDLEVLVLENNEVNLLGQNFISLFEVGIDYSGRVISLRKKVRAP